MSLQIAVRELGQPPEQPSSPGFGTTNLPKATEKPAQPIRSGIVFSGMLWEVIQQRNKTLNLRMRMRRISALHRGLDFHRSLLQDILWLCAGDTESTQRTGTGREWQ